MNFLKLENSFSSVMYDLGLFLQEDPPWQSLIQNSRDFSMFA